MQETACHRIAILTLITMTLAAASGGEELGRADLHRDFRPAIEQPAAGSASRPTLTTT